MTSVLSGCASSTYEGETAEYWFNMYDYSESKSIDLQGQLEDVQSELQDKEYELEEVQSELEEYEEALNKVQRCLKMASDFDDFQYCGY